MRPILIGVALVFFGMILHSTYSALAYKKQSLIYKKLSEQKF